ncbi:MAG: hypothetical protein ABFE01_08680 [Phycisphaerales bacterium]|jgi:hypothetical protein
MENAAHAELLDHEVYRTPLTVQPEFEDRDTPASYRRSHIGPAKLPDEFRVWRVQETQEGSVIASSYGFRDSPDAEILAVGFNNGKHYGAVGIGRHGNFLQWGYGDPPSKMTEAGRRLFLNCIHYIHRFDGKGPLVRTIAQPRVCAIAAAPTVERIWQKIQKENDKKVTLAVPDDVIRQFLGDPNGLTQYYRDNIEFIYYRDWQFRVDRELQSLGFDSNRTTATLERLISLLKDEKNTGTARSLLSRYTIQSFQEPEQWHSWFEQNKERIYFTDVGGYKFLVVPRGYLDIP